MPAYLGAFGGFVGIVVFLGAVVVYLRGSADKGTIETLERSNGALLQRVAVLEADAVRDKVDREKLEIRVAAQDREIATLQAQRPSAEVLTDIRKQLTDYIAKAGPHQAKTEALLMAIATTLGEQHDSAQ